jgi:hypothetical protein
MQKHAIHFSCPSEQIWPELTATPSSVINTERMSELSVGILSNWIIRTHYELGLRGVSSTIGPVLRKNAINFTSVFDFGRRQRDPHAFVVIPQGDAHYPQLANFVIQQNYLAPETSELSAVAHWPQPGIIPRDAERKSHIERIVFKGRTNNLDPVFRSQRFQDALAKLGMSLELDSFSGENGKQSWNDYRAADAVLAARNLTVNDARKKPASKLVNAWFADVPALLGPEPAFQELRQSELDYIEIKTPENAINALQNLKDNPDLYLAMVENGRLRRKKFNENSLADRWIQILNGPIAAAFEQWQRASSGHRNFRYVMMCLKEPFYKRAHKWDITNGPRILGKLP